ncbi:AraC family transcriptional regulator [Paenibacillus solisilvae]|uniref:AraC family transcriptional regulator n=1 Tax=Paenibacillus solisilvae TaxID=2486751 RepID=A0ABW0VV14_9BACL
MSGSGTYREEELLSEYGHEFAEYLYHTPSEFERQGGLWVIRSGRNLAKPNYEVGPKVIECFSVHAVVSGSILFDYGEGTVHLNQGDLFCLYPGLRYSYRITAGEKQLRLYWLACQGSHAEPLFARIGFSREEPYVRDRWLPSHESEMDRIHELLRTEGGSRYEVQLLSRMYRVFDALGAAPTEASSSSTIADWLARAILYMDTHYTEGIDVADAVKVAGVHRSRFYQACSRQLGISPMQYLIKLRMEKSCELLVDGQLNMQAVALSVGYPDIYAFSRAFSKYYGMAPSHYQAAFGD